MLKSLKTRQRTWIVGGVASALVVGSAVAASAAFTSGTSDDTPVVLDTARDNRDDDRDDIPESSADLAISPADAAEIALGEVEAGYVMSVELDDDDDRLVWEVEAVDSDQVDHELEIHAVDGTVLSHEKEHDDADRRDYDIAAAATVTIREAIDAAMAKTPGGQVLDVELHGDVAAPWWEVELYNETDEIWQYVKVDALDGSIISINDDYNIDDDHDDDDDDDREDD